MTLSAVVDRLIYEDVRLLVRACPSIDVTGGTEFSAVYRLQASGLMFQSVHNAGGFDDEGEAPQQFSLTTTGEQLARVFRDMCSEDG